jgi:asparagine N-glycosylation enzyme membrane subunit Stt3
VVSYLYPVLIAPAWLAGSMHTTYLLAKAINAVLMSLVAIPVYLWGSRTAPRSYALVAAALTLLLPSLFHTREL